MATVALPVLQDAACSTETDPKQEISAADAALAEGRLWRPRRVFITPDAYALPHGRAMLERAENFGAEVIRLKQNRLTGLSGEDERKAYALAKTSLAIVVSPPSARKLQPIPPSADWQFHLAQGCPAHCQYCYLAGSLSGPPITRVYANLDEILENLRGYAGTGKVTSTSAERAHEGTTFEASCYTDPLGIEHLTGGLQQTVRFFGQWDAPVQLRFTTKFAAVGPLLGLEHRRRTRVRFSLNAASVSRDFEGGTATVAQRIRALRRMALAGYPVGLTVAPIMPVEGWQTEYSTLFADVGAALDGVDAVDLTVELITHRFTAGSREVLLGWYPKTTLDLEKENRSEKRNKFGGFKYVYPRDRMSEMRSWFDEAVVRFLPYARTLYWT
ncbi:spore photoproduct lyase family protein [Terriglobus aquaticus]|uniref:Spore photoproduct lyase family protein n=1 Tax=Terriglobus aquaticus TaxID=940139 RepID=A0ABW9KQS1_9BACT|nr:radical SAM protein [Terriglobus aquaticus]